MSSSLKSALLAVVLLGGIVAIVSIGELPRLLEKDTGQSPQPARPPASSAQGHTPVAPVAPVAPMEVQPGQPGPAPPAEAQDPDSALRDRLNAELGALGLPPSSRIVEASPAGERLTLVFHGELRGALGDLSAIDAWNEALSKRVLPLGYRHLELRIRTADARGAIRDIPISELVAIPAEKRPRPDPIDDGVRR